MKKTKFQKAIIVCAVIFLAGVMLLTYFSETIDNMLLPKVKTTEVIRGSLSGELENPNENRFLVPVSAVAGFGFGSSVFRLYFDGKDYYVEEVGITIIDEDDMYYEVTAFDLFGGNQIVYDASKDIKSGDRVHREVW